MSRKLVVAWVLAPVILFGSPVSAQTVSSRTYTDTVTFSNLIFNNTSAVHEIQYGVPTQGPFAVNWSYAVYPGYSNLSLLQSGGVNNTLVTANGGTIISQVSGSGGAAGSFGIQYDYSAGDYAPLTVGRSGDTATLTFYGGGAVNGPDGFTSTVNVILPGDWSTSGIGTGDHEFLGVAPGFSLTNDFVYNSSANTTLVSVYNPDYLGGGTGLDFILFGGAVPEPATWAMLLVGVAMIGFAARRRREGAAIAA